MSTSFTTVKEGSIEKKLQLQEKQGRETEKKNGCIPGRAQGRKLTPIAQWEGKVSFLCCYATDLICVRIESHTAWNTGDRFMFENVSNIFLAFQIRNVHSTITALRNTFSIFLMRKHVKWTLQKVTVQRYSKRFCIWATAGPMQNGWIKAVLNDDREQREDKNRQREKEGRELSGANINLVSARIVQSRCCSSRADSIWQMHCVLYPPNKSSQVDKTDNFLSLYL